MTEEEIGHAIIGAAMKVHSAVGPLFSALIVAPAKAGVQGQPEPGRTYVAPRFPRSRERRASRHDSKRLKAVAAILSAHRRQPLGYQRLGGYKLGFVLNFHIAHMRDGIVRLVNGL